MTVVCTLGHHVGKIHSFAEHVTSLGKIKQNRSVIHEQPYLNSTTKLQNTDIHEQVGVDLLLVRTDGSASFGSRQLELSLFINVTHHWGLWRGNTKTLRQDTSVVGGARTVPQ